MKKGWYVVRTPKGLPDRQKTMLIVESTPFREKSAAREWARYIKVGHPKDFVTVVLMKESKNGTNDSK